MARSPMNDETRAEARRLFDAGKSRNEIARQLDLDPATITRWARREGIEFDRAATELAVKARGVDLAESRLLLAEKMLAVAHDLLDSTAEPYLVYNFGGKDNTYSEEILEHPPVEAVRSMVVTAGIAFDKATRIIERDNGGMEQAVGVLDQLAGVLSSAADTIRAETTDAGQ